MTIDLCIVATRRPGLLQTTIASFQGKIFPSLPIGDVFVNIDPVFGTSDDQERCRDIIRNHFPRAVIFEPENPSFGGAVKRLWAATSADYVFHLEDDWIALQDVGKALLAAFSNPTIAQVAFNTKEKLWDIRKRGPLHQRRRRFRLLGIKISLPWMTPRFTTSPSLLRGNFARHCSSLMNDELDPEKQFFQGTNPALESYVARFKTYLFPESGEFLIEDIGRDWRRHQGIEKTMVDGRSLWVSAATVRMPTIEQ